MKKIVYICSILLLIAVASSCKKQDGIDQDLSFLNTVNSSNFSKIFDISNDNSGIVKITPLGEGVASYTVNFGQGTGADASAVVAPGYNTSHAYPEGTYTVSIIATDLAGKTTTTAYPLTLTYKAPEKLTVTFGSGMVVSATADFAKSFLVYYGDVANEVGTPLALGAKLPAHVYPAGGPFDVKVIALSGGAATAELIKTTFSMPITFEIATANYFFGTFGTGQVFATVANPNATGLNTTANVGKFTRGAEGWSGTYSPLDLPIDFSKGNKIKVWVYNPDPALIGKKLNVELEAATGGTPANGIGVLKVPVTTSGAWEELVFDFSTIPAIPSTARYNQLVFRFNDATDGAGAIIYIDNIRFTN